MSPYGVTSSKQIYPKADHHVCMHGQHCEMQGTVYTHVSLAVDGDAEIEKVRSRYVVGMYNAYLIHLIQESWLDWKSFIPTLGQKTRYLQHDI